MVEVENYSKKELKTILKTIKNTNGQIFSWCEICKRVSLHTFRTNNGDVTNLLTCFDCKDKSNIKYLNEDGSVDRYYLFTISEKAKMIQSLKNEKDKWESKDPKNKEGSISKELNQMIKQIAESVKNE